MKINHNVLHDFVIPIHKQHLSEKEKRNFGNTILPEKHFEIWRQSSQNFSNKCSIIHKNALRNKQQTKKQIDCAILTNWVLSDDVRYDVSSSIIFSQFNNELLENKNIELS